MMLSASSVTKRSAHRFRFVNSKVGGDFWFPVDEELAALGIAAMVSSNMWKERL